VSPFRDVSDYGERNGMPINLDGAKHDVYGKLTSAFSLAEEVMFTPHGANAWRSCVAVTMMRMNGAVLLRYQIFNRQLEQFVTRIPEEFLRPKIRLDDSSILTYHKDRIRRAREEPLKECGITPNDAAFTLLLFHAVSTSS
jgi:hypothetical protein